MGDLRRFLNVFSMWGSSPGSGKTSAAEIARWAAPDGLRLTRH